MFPILKCSQLEDNFNELHNSIKYSTVKMATINCFGSLWPTIQPAGATQDLTGFQELSLA
jgi:hypothetical protein